jgi:hypothetical protein
MNVKKRKFHVHLIESNAYSTSDAEAKAFQAILKISGIPSSTYSVRNLTEFRKAIEEVENHKWTIANSHRKYLPWLHFALHGCQDGILLSKKVKISWDELREILAPLSKKLEGNLMLCMSACHGFFGYKMSETMSNLPYHFLLGTRKKLDWEDAVLAFHVFYRKLFCTRSIRDAVEAMNALKLGKRYSFDYKWGAEIQQAYLAKSKRKR